MEEYPHFGNWSDSIRVYETPKDYLKHMKNKKGKNKNKEIIYYHCEIQFEIVLYQNRGLLFE